MIMKKSLILALAASLVLSACGLLGEKPAPEPSPTVSFALDIATAAPAPTATQVFPVTLEDTIFSALTFYRQQGFEAFKSTWLTDEFAARTQFADFLAAMVNNAATTPSALMGWEIQKSEAETGGTLPQGTMKALVKTSYQGGVAVCRWLFLSPPQLTGNHWRIAENQITACEGATPVPAAAAGQPAAGATPAATSASGVWYPCPGAPASGIQIGSKVYVNPYPPLGVWMRISAGENTKRMGMLQPGETIVISGGPSCTAGHVYWQVHYIDYMTPDSTDAYVEYDAWIAEMLAEDNYLLLPCPASGACGGGFTPVRTQISPIN